MRIVTAGDARAGTDSSGVAEQDGVGFRAMIVASCAQAERFGYRISVYDLGGLGLGEPFDVGDDTFRRSGYYRKLSSDYYSKALHKPDVIARCLEEHGDFTVYLDGDAVLWKPIDDVVGEFDIAVTLRHSRELLVMREFISRNRESIGLINAGVIFLQASEKVLRFVAQWKEATLASGSDQRALNHLLAPESPSAVGSTAEKHGLRVKYLPAEEYNYYYFDYGHRPLPDTVRIMHFKAGVRRFFRVYHPDLA